MLELRPMRGSLSIPDDNDRIDANKICDCLRCDFLPECYMAPTAIRERRRTLRYRNLLVRQMVQMKIKISSLLMEAGVSYNKQRLHKAGYFRELLATNPDIDEGLRSLLRLCRETVVRLLKTEGAMVRSLERDSLLMDPVQQLMTNPETCNSECSATYFATVSSGIASKYLGTMIFVFGEAARISCTKDCKASRLGC